VFIDRVTDRRGTSHRTGRAVKGREDTIAEVFIIRPLNSFTGSVDDPVMFVEYRWPPLVAHSG
jgi:hypothetical protein